MQMGHPEEPFPDEGGAMTHGPMAQWILNRVAKPGQLERLPIRLGRRRIYTLPTGAGLILGFMLLVFLVAALNYNSNAALAVTLWAASVGLVSLIAGHQHLNGVDILDVIGEAGHAGDVVTVQVTLQARPGQEGLILLSDQSGVVFDLDSHGRGVARIAVAALERGCWTLPRLGLASRQSLGLATSWAWFWAKHRTVLVWPALEPEPVPLPLSDGGQQQTVAMAHASEEVRSLRAYQPGDPIRQISWKHSARLGIPMVREYDRPAGYARLDWQALTGLGDEARLSRLATWVVEADRCGRSTQLILPGTTLGPGRGEAHKRACLDALALRVTHAS